MTIPILSINVAPNGSFAIPSNNFRMAVVLLANTEQRITVPTDAGTGKKPSTAFFACPATFYADYTYAGSDVLAAIPVGTITDGTAPSQSPTVRNIPGVTKISLIADTACVVVIDFAL